MLDGSVNEQLVFHLKPIPFKTLLPLFLSACGNSLWTVTKTSLCGGVPVGGCSDGGSS